MKPLVLLIVLCLTVPPVHAQAAAKTESPAKERWRVATPHELESALPARAQVEKDRIEVEMRTASGVIDRRGRVIAGVVLITAGYSAEGKYSHFLLAQSPLVMGDLHLAAGNYVLGWRRKDDDSLQVSIYDAATGTPKGGVLATRKPTPGGRVESFRFWPPDGTSEIQIGRFFLHYSPGE